MKPLLLALPLIGLASAGHSQTTVTIGELDWPGARAIEQVLAQVMEANLDVKVEVIAAAQDALYEALNKGDGSVDVVADMWTDHLPQQVARYVAPGSAETILLNATPYLGTDGIFVPAYVATEMGVTKLSDLAKPEVAALFDTDQNGKGEVWGGAIGWESANHTAVRGKTYGFDQTMEYTNVDQAVILSQITDAIAAKKPIAFYYWTPEWIHAAYELHLLEEPAFDGFGAESAKGTARYKEGGCYTFYQPAERDDWLEASTISCGQPPTNVHIAHSRDLADRAPIVSQFLKQVVLDADTVNGWILATEVDKTPVEEVASTWIAANADLINGTWLAGIK